MSPVLDAREKLLRELAADVGDRRVLDAMRAVPRQLFVPVELRRFAWSDQPLPIAEGQSISQPLVVAHMCELLRLAGTERVLDVGTGSGYHAAVLSRLASRVWSIERHPALSEQAGENLRTAGVSGVTLIVGDGSLGYPDAAPFDAINVAAASWDGVPAALENQLADGGRLIVPVAGVSGRTAGFAERTGGWGRGTAGFGEGERGQRLVLVERRGDELRRSVLRGVRFVPLVAD